ncbi:flagellar basal body P-ring protein FlgI [bacterium]|nr:flagellar basal body P-ring protein FlgI [bacterium]
MRRLILSIAVAASVWAEPIPIKIELGGPISPLARPAPLARSRLKDIARVAGLNQHSLTGYGLVAGLPNSGDSQSALSSPLVVNLLTQLGMQLNPALSNGLNRNVAVVAVTAELPAYCRSGDRIDVRVSSLGDAKDLQGGTLLSSLLRGPDGKVYGSAQGSVSSLSPTTAVQGSKPAVTGVATLAGTVSQNLESPALTRAKVYWELFQPDLSTATRVATALTGQGLAARVVGPGTIEMDFGPGADSMGQLARAGEVEVELDRSARIICDERTGTVVAGSEVRLMPTVISHRGVTLEIGSQGATLRSVVESLQKAGATPREILGVVQTLHKVGSLSGELLIR